MNFFLDIQYFWSSGRAHGLFCPRESGEIEARDLERAWRCR